MFEILEHLLYSVSRSDSNSYEESVCFGEQCHPRNGVCTMITDPYFMTKKPFESGVKLRPKQTNKPKR